jgi:hypothetical protein
MKVFLGWSGDRSKALAEALRDWLPLVLHYVQPWMSQADIAAGERWSTELATELGASNFGIISLTQDNAAEPWILFEAGCLAKSLQEAKVIPLLLDLEQSDVTGPLAQFQAKKTDKDGVEAVITSINGSAPNPAGDARVKPLFDALWPQLEKKVGAIPQLAAAKPRRPQHDILEDLVVSARSVDSRLGRVEEMVDDSRGGVRSRRNRRMFHPMMFDEFSHMAGRGPGDPVGLLMLASMFRDEFPPLYELGMDACRAISAGRVGEVECALDRLERFSEYLAHGPMMEEFGMGSKEMHMMMRELPHMLHRITDEIRGRQVKGRPLKKEPTSTENVG